MIEAIPIKMNNANKIVLKFLKDSIFNKFRIPRVIISVRGAIFTINVLTVY